ncbi:efflux RND transporter periplasmic adaptor subunit [Desulfocurvibacter africanus]|uniref:efflux RND transporter periplasmic adaptor subunit n=1 Tax=Desulfocurvibacter africanus TaxID=873 RepID=UPI001EE68E96|nr:efflux RND transporter periplasmic adaptor subunit [Desulfocurvibacter africanus]
MGCATDQPILARGAAWVWLALLLCGLAACGEEPQQATEEPSVAVETAMVRRSDFLEDVTGIGTLLAVEVVRIRPEVSGIVREIRFREGERVEIGALLFLLDDDKLRRELAANLAALESARASLENARRSYQRFWRLYERRTVSRDELDQRETGFSVTRAEVDRLAAQVALDRERMEDMRIRAPMAGSLSQRNVDVGDYVEEADELVTLYSDRLEISFDVPERYMGRVRLGQPVRITVTAYPEREFEGRVSFVSPSVDVETRKFTVKALVGDPESLLKPGAFATARLVLDVRENRPAVPEAALVATREGYLVFVVRDGKAVMRPVDIGLRRTGLAEVRQGLDIGQEVVVAGQLNLSDGTPVQITARGGNDASPAGTEGPGTSLARQPGDRPRSDGTANPGSPSGSVNAAEPDRKEGPADTNGAGDGP